MIKQSSGKPAAVAKRPRGRGWRRSLAVVTVPLRRFLGHHVFSSLTRRILFLNLAGLAVLVAGILYLNTFRDGLIDARVESLMTQGEIIAGAIAASATVETDSISIDPEKLLELQAGESLGPGSDQLDNLDFPINPGARGAGAEAADLADPHARPHLRPRRQSAARFAPSLFARPDPSLRPAAGRRGRAEPLRPRPEIRLRPVSAAPNLPIYHEQPGGNGAAFPEVMNALTGSPSTVVRVSEQGEQIVSVAVPIQRFRAVLGVLMLSTEGGDIDKIVAAERKAILRVFGVAALVTAILSMLLASTIANPLRRLSAAAVRVRRGVKNREEIPDFSDRQDEIGNLSVAVRDMTNALYARIEAIESFAADVAHELKNPLTSLRSAVETLPLAKNEASRGRLMEIIQHDVRRLDRLITDISDASRLDAELAREDADRVDLKKLVTDLVGVSREAGAAEAQGRHRVQGGQAAAGRQGLFRHRPRSAHRPGHHQSDRECPLLRARGPRPHHRQRWQRAGKFNIVTVDDNGPGIRADEIDRIFERFYTDRPVRRGVRPEFRPRPVDQPPDRRGAWRHADRRKHSRHQAGRHQGRALRRDAAGRRLRRGADLQPARDGDRDR